MNLIDLLIRRRATLLWMILITGVSFWPGSGLPDLAMVEFDKLIHVVLYAVLAVLAGREKLLIASVLSRRNAEAFALLFGFGLALELLQGRCVLGRSFEWYDLLANGFGLTLGFGLWRLVSSFKSD